MQHDMGHITVTRFISPSVSLDRTDYHDKMNELVNATRLTKNSNQTQHQHLNVNLTVNCLN